MNITVNGTPRRLADGCSAAQLLAELGAPRTGIAVAVDGEVLPRVSWDTALPEGAAVEVLTAVQGG